jgi:hypothetical protein
MGTSSINDRGRGGFAICHVGFEEKALVPAFALQDDSRLFNPLGCMAENSGTGELEMLLVWFHSCGSYHPILISLKSWCDTRPIYSENNMEISPAVENPNMEPKISSVCFFSYQKWMGPLVEFQVFKPPGLHVEPHLQAACSLDVFRIFQTVCYDSWHVPGVAPQSGL